MTVVGIDLGTTNTVVAAARSGRAVALKDDAGRSLLPSVVSFHPNGEVLIGHEAKERRTVDARNTIFSVKRLIGRSWDSEQVQRARARLPFSMKDGPGKSTLVEARGHAYTLPEISALVLERAKGIAERRLAAPVEGCVITVPANFNDLQRAATKVAGRVAGLEVLRILNEPTAAALAYGFGKTGRERIAVYDFGGGTFDVTLLDLSENVFEVLATAGDTFLGGDDVDRLIAERMAERLLAKHRIDASADVQLFERLRAAAENVKVELSTQLATKVTLSEVGHGMLGKAVNFEFEMKRSELEALTEPLVDRTLEVCREALGIAGATVKDFDQVLLVGGSTRSPQVRKKVGSFFERPPQTRLNPDEVVAIGAAIQATALGATRTASIPAPPLPAAGMRRSSPSWTSEAPRPRLGSVPPDTSLDSPLRARLGSVPPDTSLDSPRPRLGSVPPDVTRPARRSEHSVLARLEAKPPPVVTPPALPGSPAPNTFAGVGPRGRLRTQAGIGPASPLVVPPAHALTSPPPLGPASAEPQAASSPVADARADELDELDALEEPEIEDLDFDEVTSAHHPSAPLPAAPGAARPPSSIPPLGAPAARLPSVPPLGATTGPSTPPLVAPSAAALTARAIPAPRIFELPEADEDETERAPRAVRSPAVGALDPRASFETESVRARSFAEPPRAPLAPPKAPLLVDVTPLALGVEVVGGYCDTLIARNSPVPCEHSRAFVTAKDDQTTVRVRVSQGQSSRFADNTVLGEVELSGLTPAPRGAVRIEVTFALDESGILSVSARNSKTGAATRAQLKLVGLGET